MPHSGIFGAHYSPKIMETVVSWPSLYPHKNTLKSLWLDALPFLIKIENRLIYKILERKIIKCSAFNQNK